jgi:hypothetical protein
LTQVVGIVRELPFGEVLQRFAGREFPLQPRGISPR